MRATVRHLHSPDVPDLARWRPTEEEHFGILLQVFVGPSDGPGQESFDFVVCSPEWLRRKYGDDAVIFCRNHILLFRYDFSILQAAVESLVSRVSGDSWNEIASKLARYGLWEFEEYEDVPLENAGPT